MWKILHDIYEMMLSNGEQIDLFNIVAISMMFRFFIIAPKLQFQWLNNSMKGMKIKSERLKSIYPLSYVPFLDNLSEK